MRASRRSYHAQHIKAKYSMDFPNNYPTQEILQDILESGKFEDLPLDFFKKLHQNGYGFGRGVSIPLDMLTDMAIASAEGNSGLVIITISNFNIFNSMQENAKLAVAGLDGTNYAFLTADFFENKKETIPVYAEKRVYAQPLALQEVLRRAYNGLKGKGRIDYFVIPLAETISAVKLNIYG